jgi:hypothetical protein
MENEKISWQAYEYRHTEKGADWFWALGIIAVSISITAVIFGNILFAIFIILSAFTLGMLARKPPKIMDIEIGDKGVKIGKSFYAYSSIQSFWVDEQNENDKRLIIKVDSITMPHFSILADNVDLNEVKERLLNFIPEEEYIEPISHKIMERLGF